VVVLLPLVARGEDSHRPRALYLEQCDVPRPAEGNDQFAEKGTDATAYGFAAREWKDFQQFDHLGNRSLGALRFGKESCG
jgi:hypothetical protein